MQDRIYEKKLENNEENERERQEEYIRNNKNMKMF